MDRGFPFTCFDLFPQTVIFSRERVPLLIFFFPLQGLILVPAGRSQLENTKYRERRGETEGRRMERWLNMCAEDKDGQGGKSK